MCSYINVHRLAWTESLQSLTQNQIEEAKKYQSLSSEEYDNEEEEEEESEEEEDE